MRGWLWVMLCLIGFGARAEPVTLAGPGGLALKAQMFRPAVARDVPAIVALHGCGGPFGARDRILLYTDGIIEATAADDSMFEFGRLKSSLEASLALSSRATVDRLLDDVTAFAGKETPSDDRTLILISRTP